jgi:glycosyltransferase involved in cell wall biosynthesis
MKNKKTVAIILPAYNECLTIKSTIADFNKTLPGASIWVIDNKSSDDTYRVASETLSELNCFGGVLKESRPGKGNAIRKAFRLINADVYIMADADLTYPAKHAPKFIDLILNHSADMVVGDRLSNGAYKNENKRLFHDFGNSLVRYCVNKIFRSNLRDIMSGYRAFSKAFVKNFPVMAEGFELEVDISLHALDKRFSIIEVPIDYKDRPNGSISKLNTISDGAKVLFTIFNIFRHYRPLLFFGIISLIISCLGFFAAIPVLNDWITTHYILHIPMAILATGLEILASLTLIVGLILDSIAYHDRRNFEKAMLKNE